MTVGIRASLLAALWWLPPAASRCDTPWETYLQVPSPQNAALVSAIAYSADRFPDKYRYLHLELLAVQVVAGDVEALRLALRLSAQADAHRLEELTAIVASAIRPQAALFLAEVPKSVPEQELRSILLMPGPMYVDLPQAKRYELDMRRAALARIHDPSLADARARCVAILDRALQ